MPMSHGAVIMKVIHLPYNIASQLSVTVRALRELGVDARGLVRNTSTIQDHKGIEYVPWQGSLSGLKRLARSLRWRLKLLKAMHWADIIHWYWGQSTWGGWDLRIARLMGKPRLIEFWGDDIRIPEIASRGNPYLARMYELHPDLNMSNSLSAQHLFARNGFQCLLPHFSFEDFLDKRAFPEHFQTRTRILMDEYQPHYPDAAKATPLVVHAPSHKVRKGTEAVLRAIDMLKGTHSFEFQLIHEMRRSDALQRVQDCDVFLDQFTIGAEGLAAQEAMALGKPVVCFIAPGVLVRYPHEFPIVNANQEDLPDVLRSLLVNGERRRELGLRGRKYVEKYHDARKFAADLFEIYKLGQSRCVR